MSLSWRGLLQEPDEALVLPWTGGRELITNNRTWRITKETRLPPEHGWWRWHVTSRDAKWDGNPNPQEPKESSLGWYEAGYLVGDRFLAHGAGIFVTPLVDLVVVHTMKPEKIRTQLLDAVSRLPKAHFIDPTFDRFTRVKVARTYEEGPRLFVSMEMPTGAETDVLSAYLDQAPDLSKVKGVAPGLALAFHMETWQRIDTEQRRIEHEARLAALEVERATQERRAVLIKQIGSGEGRRELAKVDFAAAAKAALAVGGATLIETKKGAREHIVRFRFDGERFECTCDETLHVIDAGICLVDHYSGTKGDQRFTLESLPAVIAEAIREHKLVKFRHI